MKIKMLCDSVVTDVQGRKLVRHVLKKGDVLDTESTGDDFVTRHLAATLLNNGSAYWADASPEAMARAELECDRRLAESRETAEGVAAMVVGMLAGMIGNDVRQFGRDLAANPQTYRDKGAPL